MNKNFGTVQIVEVSPRDGLQNESVMLGVTAKVELIERAIASGIRRVEATSFVNPKVVPQMADAEQVMAALTRSPDVSLIGLVLNQRGFARAVAAHVDEVNFVVSASDTFNRKNQGADTAQSMAVWRSLAAEARNQGIRTTVTIAMAFGCPFEGEIPVSTLVDLVRQIIEFPPDELALADTIGVAVPSDVEERIGAVHELIPTLPLRCHFHNTRNTGMTNAVAAVQAGVRVLDSSIGGIGGCPFAPAATGNIPTEDLIYLLERMGYSTGLDLPSVCDTATWLGDRLGSPVPGLLSRAGPFPSHVPLEALRISTTTKGPQ